MTRVLDYVPRLDDRNRGHRIRASLLDGEVLAARPRFWVPGPVLDQGREGACVGFGCTAEALASPVRWKPSMTWEGLSTTAASDAAARDVYRRAKEIDEWEGVDYEGTSVRAGMLVGRERGWWTGFRWAFNMAELRAALEEGPVVIGVDWTDGMYEAPRGVLSISGDVVGGHCILVTGYSPHMRAYRLRNSWGPDWGRNGSAYINAADLNSILFRAGGEAAVPIGRAA